MNPITLFLFNFFLNSIFVFFTSWLLVEALLFIFRIKNFRIKYFARCIPIIKIFVDLSLYNFSKWAVLHNINPILCKAGSRTLSIGLGANNFIPNIFISFHLPENITFSLTDIIGISIGNAKMITIIIIFMLVSTYGLTRFIISYKEKKLILKKMLRNLANTKISTSNEYLQMIIKKKKVSFKTSDKIYSPCVLKENSKCIIVFPKDFYNVLTDEEIEAILHHELQHIIWYDNNLHMFFSFLKSLIYFNPLLNYWNSLMKLTRECACDQKGNKMHLATAIQKFHKRKDINSYMTIAFINKTTIVKRLNALLINDNKSKLLRNIKTVFLIAALTSILFGKVWIF